MPSVADKNTGGTLMAVSPLQLETQTQIGFLVSVSSASNFVCTSRNQNFHSQILKLHFHVEETKGGGKEPVITFLP